MCGFYIYPKFFMKFLQILHGQFSEVHCLIRCLKIFKLSEFFISFGKFRHRTVPIVLIVSKPNFFCSYIPSSIQFASFICFFLSMSIHNLHFLNEKMFDLNINSPCLLFFDSSICTL